MLADTRCYPHYLQSIGKLDTMDLLKPVFSLRDDSCQEGLVFGLNRQSSACYMAGEQNFSVI